MNAHIPQSYEAHTELEDIASVPLQIIRPRDGEPVIGIVQDTLVGSYLATKPDNYFTRREFMNLMMWNKRFEKLPAPRVDPDGPAPRYTGQQIISTLLPPINVNMPNNNHKKSKADNDYVKIEEGEMLQGIIDKSIFNKPGKGIVHTTYNDYGPKDAVALIDSLQTVLESYLILKGFSVGISDLIADKATQERMDIIIKEKKKQIEEIILQVHMDLFTNNSGKSNQDEFESRIFSILNKAIEELGDLGQESLAAENRLISMIRAGSKGGPINVSQMIACVGQQNVEGKRTPYGFTDRTLPHYKKYNDGAEARGFVESSFIRGLTPQEFFFHAMSGREGLIDTAVKTAETGYTQRKLIKAMEDLMTQHDGTVRDANGNILQFYYGEDGLNSTKIETTQLPINEFTQQQIDTQFGLQNIDFGAILQEGVTRTNDADLLAAYVASVKEDQRMIVEGVFGSGRMGEIFGPLNLERIILNIKTKFKLNAMNRTDLVPETVLRGIDTLIQRTQSYNKTWCACIRYHLSPYNIIVKERFTQLAWDALIEIVLVKNMKAWAVPGELVGIIAAQSIGEPATQMSCVYDTQVRINGPNGYYTGPIGKFIDDLLAANKKDVKKVPKHADSVVYDPKEHYTIPGVSAKEKASWNRILQVSRHPANGGLVEVVTNSGRRTIATLSHSFLRRTESGITEVKGSELVIGNRIPVASYLPEVPNPIKAVTLASGTSLALDRAFGWICGMYLSDGVLHDSYVAIHKVPGIVEENIRAWASKYNYNVSSREYKADFGVGKAVEIHSQEFRDWLESTYKYGSSKTISGLVYNSPAEYICGVVSGYFDGGASVNTERQQIRISSRSKDLIQHISNLCAYGGVFGTLSKDCNENGYYIYNLLRNYADVFEQTIGFQLQEKAEGLQSIIQYNNRDDAHSKMGLVDKIPELGEIIGFIAEQLHLPGCSRLYKRWRKKESIGRETLRKYILVFREHIQKKDAEDPDRKFLEERLDVLVQAAYSDVVWDEIVELNYLDDPKTYVYDFTVPGNDSFLVDNNIFVHNTLNTFHLAGVAAKSNMTRGVPRLNELLKVTHNPKASSLTVYLKPEFRNNKDRVREVMQDLELTLLKDITLKSAIYFDPRDENTTIPEDRELISFYKLFEDREVADRKTEPNWSKWLLRLEFDREKMFNRNITMDDINFVLNNKFYQEIHTVYSDYNSTKLVMRIRLSNLSDQGDAPFGDHLNALKRFQSKILNNIIIRGVEGIRAVTFRKSKDFVESVDGEYKPVDQYILDTDGSNYIEVMNHAAVDGNRIYSTNVHDVYDQLGIEATRNALYTEIAGLFEDTKINYRHLGLLVDVMTRSGKLMSVDRNGINKNNIGPLAKACFEETERMLLKAAQFGEIDPVTGVSANIMTGQPIRGGTAFSQILLDEEILPRLLAGQSAIPGEDEEEEQDIELTQENIDYALFDDSNDPCSLTRLHMNMNIPMHEELIEEDDIEITTI